MIFLHSKYLLFYLIVHLVNLKLILHRFEQRVFRKGNQSWNTLVLIWNWTGIPSYTWHKTKTAPSKWIKFGHICFFRGYNVCCRFQGRSLVHSSWIMYWDESTSRSLDIIQCSFALACRNNRLMVTNCREVKVFLKGHWSKCMPLVRMSNFINEHVSWKLNSNLFLFCCGVHVVFACVAWVGANPVLIDDSHPFVSVVDWIPYTDSKLKYYWKL